jgi:hypothetical protein
MTPFFTARRRLVQYVLCIMGLCGIAQAADYLPLQANTRWVLKNPRTATPVTIEVVSKNGDTYRVRFSDPWGENEWDIEKRNSTVYMTAYGQNGKLAPMPPNTAFFNFSPGQGEKWTNAIGTLSVVNTHALVKTRDTTFPDCIQIKQISGKTSFLYTFAPGIGFVQFGEGNDAFFLDTNGSTLPAAAKQSSIDDRPAQHVPGGIIGTGAKADVAPRPSSTPTRPDARPLNIGITASVFANEQPTPQNLLKRFDQTSDAGITFLTSAQKWTEIETKPGQYNLEGLDFQISTANRLNITMSVTLRLIDTVDRVVPGDLKHVSWDSKEMTQRTLSLVDAISSHFHGRVKWFMFGNEIDGYFGRHPDEVQSYSRLFAQVKQHLKHNSPETLMSSTLMFGGIDALNGMLASINSQCDFVAITYYPIRGNFTMRPPDVVLTDFGKMREVASGRKVILQEIGYPSSSLNGSSQDKQAEFYKDVFQAMRQNRDLIEAGNFFLLSDLPDKFVKDLAGFYGMPNQAVFLAFLQTLGMFDLQGRPKKSWDVFRTEMEPRRLSSN